MTEENQDLKVLEVLVAEGKSVKIGETRSVIVRPLPLPHIPKLLRAISKIFQNAKMVESPFDATAADLLVYASEDMLEMLPLCIDVPLEDLPSTAAPDLFEAFIEVNLTDTIVKKWAALFQNLTVGMKGQGQEKV